MATVTFILGYCGSGKTPLVLEMEREGVRRFDEGFLCNPTQHYAELIEALRSNADCVVVDIGFCEEGNLERITRRLQGDVPNVAIKHVYFEADLDKANKNCRTRNNKPDDPEGKKHIEINNRIGSSYKVPSHVCPRRIRVGP
jgi:hypothetical protein